METMQRMAPELNESIKNKAEISVVDPVVLLRVASGPNKKMEAL